MTSQLSDALFWLLAGTVLVVALIAVALLDAIGYQWWLIEETGRSHQRPFRKDSRK
jgi:cytochrome c-type biogenesis protein CcmH/NrfG